MRFGIIITVCVGLIIGVLYIISFDERESMLLGEWEEHTWIYESSPIDGESIKTNKDTISNNVKSLLGKSLFIHSAEKWTFNSDKKLNIDGCEQQDKYSWYVKGRGNILVLDNESQNIKETYEIVHISNDSLVLALDLDMQVQGLAKLIFKKI